MKQLEISSLPPEAPAPAGEAAPAPEPFEEEVFGRYRLLRRIGKGGMAEAFLAVMEGAKGFRRKCVVKRIRPEKAGSTYFTQMFVDEARITAALHHPNIVQVYEFGEVGELFYLTMEYLDGPNLGAVLDALHAQGLLMPINMAAHVAQQVARGLHYAHRLTDDAGVPLGVIHRDVSPSNVMLLRTGEVKILDFGVAKAERALKQGATVVGKVKGKLSYMAPEQHSGKNVDRRADVFAAGVMLWEMLTGEMLFSGPKGGERSRRMMRGDVPAPSTLRAKVPPELDAIVLRCLQVQPEDRFASAGALADALGAVVRASLFDPAELATLVSEHAGEPPSESESDPASSGAPLVIDSHAILTREDEHAHLDLDLMAATTSRDRARPHMRLARPPGPVERLPAPEAPPVAASPALPTPRWRRLWPALVVLGAAAAVAVVMALPSRGGSSSLSVSAPRRARAEITPVPPAASLAPTVEVPAPALEARAAEPLPGVGPTRASAGKSPAPARRRRAPEAAAPKPAEHPPGAAPAAGGDRLVNPF